MNVFTFRPMSARLRVLVVFVVVVAMVLGFMMPVPESAGFVEDIPKIAPPILGACTVSGAAFLVCLGAAAAGTAFVLGTMWLFGQMEPGSGLPDPYKVAGELRSLDFAMSKLSTSYKTHVSNWLGPESPYAGGVLTDLYFRDFVPVTGSGLQVQAGRVSPGTAGSPFSVEMEFYLASVPEGTLMIQAGVAMYDVESGCGPGSTTQLVGDAASFTGLGWQTVTGVNWNVPSHCGTWHASSGIDVGNTFVTARGEDFVELATVTMEPIVNPIYTNHELKVRCVKPDDFDDFVEEQAILVDWPSQLDFVELPGVECPAGYMPQWGEHTVAPGTGTTGEPSTQTSTHAPWLTEPELTPCILGLLVGEPCTLRVLKKVGTAGDVDVLQDCDAVAENCVDWYLDPQRTTKYQCWYGPYRLGLEQCTALQRHYNPGPTTIDDSGTTEEGEPITDPILPPTGDPTNPFSDPADPTMPLPPPGSNDGGDCFPSGWGLLNPIEWVLKPTKCALAWAFIPRSEVVADFLDGLSEAFPFSLAANGIEGVVALKELVEGLDSEAPGFLLAIELPGAEGGGDMTFSIVTPTASNGAVCTLTGYSDLCGNWSEGGSGGAWELWGHRGWMREVMRVGLLVMFAVWGYQRFEQMVER